MNVGDLVKWNKFLGIVIGTDIAKQYGGRDGWEIYVVSWSDGGISRMYMDELVVISE